MSTQEFIIKLIKLLKPEFYNKITWAIVIAGLALMATPFWEEILLAVVKKEYELDLGPGGNIPWGFALVVVGLLYHLTSNSLLQVIEYKDREKTESNRVKHDSDIFKASQEIMNERFLTNFFEWLLSDHSYRTNDRSNSMRMPNTTCFQKIIILIMRYRMQPQKYQKQSISFFIGCLLISGCFLRSKRGRTLGCVCTRTGM